MYLGIKKRLSSADKYDRMSSMKEKNDPTLDTLLDLNGFIAEIGRGYWVKIEARKVKEDTAWY